MRILWTALTLITLFVFSLFLSLQQETVQDGARCWVTKTFYSPHRQGAVPEGTPAVQARAQTQPVFNRCDAADDPAIWVNRSDPDNSLIVATNKRRGLNVYSLQGQLLTELIVGATNNVDLREFVIQGRPVIVVGASHKGDGEVHLYQLHPETAELTPLHKQPLKAQVEKETYGFCLYASPRTQSLYAIATDKSGQIEQWLLTADMQGLLSGELKRTLRVDTQPEGCVADDVNGALFVGEEGRGIWKFAAEPDASSQGALIAQASEPLSDGVHLFPDVEGLAIYAPDGGSTQGYLLASSQGNDTYVLFDRTSPHAYRGSFQIEADGFKTGDTDGLDVTALPVGNTYPDGLLVVQDGAPAWQGRHNQNYKLVSWKSVMRSLHIQGVSGGSGVSTD